jgi:hypothetical protein
MNTPELTLKELQEMEHDLKQYYGGCFLFGERKLESLLSLARLQIESQGVTDGKLAPSNTSVACAPPAHSDVVPALEAARNALRVYQTALSYLWKHGVRCPEMSNELLLSAQQNGDAQIKAADLVLKRLTTTPPIHTEESPSDSELLTDGDVERLEDLQKALKAEGYRNSLSHEMGVLIPRILPVLRSVIKAAMKQEK